MASQMDLLSNKFNRLLNEYKNTYEEYINYIKSEDNSLKQIENTSFISNNKIGVIENSSLNECSASCSKNNNCLGATFISQQNLCNLNSGNDGSLVNSPNNTAFVKKGLYYSHKLKKINDELTIINTNMMQLTNSKFGDFQEKQNTNAKHGEILKNNYIVLQEERLKIEKMAKQYETLNSAYEYGNINTNSNYYNYIIYLIIAVFLFFTLLKISSSNVVTNNQLGGKKINLENFIKI